MDKRKFLQVASLACLSTYAWPSLASLLPANPIFGRSFDDLKGNAQNLSQFMGKPVLLNFWASWCAPCVREMPLLESLHHEHPDLALIGIAIDTKSNVLRFLEKTPVSYPILLAGTQGITIMRDLGNKNGGLPFSVLFNRDGQAVDRSLGELKEDDIRSRLKSIL